MWNFTWKFLTRPKQDPYFPFNFPTEGPLAETMFRAFMEDLFTGLFEYLDKKEKEEANETSNRA